MPKGKAYPQGVNESQHIAMLDTIKQCKGSVMLSGYPNELYDQTLSGWTHYDRQIDNKVSGASKKRKMTESLWCNF